LDSGWWFGFSPKISTTVENIVEKRLLPSFEAATARFQAFFCVGEACEGPIFRRVVVTPS
jgi:hypothetical protein